MNGIRNAQSTSFACEPAYRSVHPQDWWQSGLVIGVRLGVKPTGWATNIDGGRRTRRSAVERRREAVEFPLQTCLIDGGSRFHSRDNQIFNS